MIAGNLAELFIKQANENNNKVAVEYRLRRNEPYKTILWGHLSTLVKEVAYGLIELGLKKNDNVAILSTTRYEWAVSDLAILSCGGVVVPIYPTLPEQLVNYILNNSCCEIVILEDKGQLQKVRSQWDKLPKVRYVIVMEDLGDLPENDSRIISFKNLKDKGKLNFANDPDLIEKHLSEINDYDTAAIIYTSGTTGQPKGVMLTHKNILSVLEVLPEMLPTKPEDKFLSFLPLSHVFEKVGGLYYSIYCGNTISYCSSIEQIGSALKDSGATLMLVVPRILEKIYSKIYSNFDSLPDFKRKMINWALNIGKKVLKYKSNEKAASFLHAYSLFQYKIADTLVFKSLRKSLAPRLRFFISGGAPLSREIAEFFWIIGIPVLEGYGLTETSAPVTVNTLNEIKFGTVGKPLSNVSLKIADDGEILVKGPNVFTGYYKNDTATKEAFKDGWFCTGDIGFVDKEGYLIITDRKKDIIKNSGGKIIAPQNIENALKNSKFISNAVVIGDKKKYLSALITLDQANIYAYANGHEIAYNDGMNDLSNNPMIINLIQEEIKFRTADFADYEQIRRFTILPNDFTIESGDITPTLKVKRKFVEQKYKKSIDAMYPPE